MIENVLTKLESAKTKYKEVTGQSPKFIQANYKTLHEIFGSIIPATVWPATSLSEIIGMKLIAKPDLEDNLVYLSKEEIVSGAFLIHLVESGDSP